MFTKMRNRMESEEGFTLIELLVVILIIGILAAIAIPSFLNQREKGQDACAKSMARTMQTAMETFYVDTNSYNNASPAALTAIESQVAQNSCGPAATINTGPAGAATQCVGNNPGVNAGYCVSSLSAAVGGGQHTFAIHRAVNGTISRVCAPAGQGACGAAGTW